MIHELELIKHIKYYHVPFVILMIHELVKHKVFLIEYFQCKILKRENVLIIIIYK